MISQFGNFHRIILSSRPREITALVLQYKESEYLQNFSEVLNWQRQDPFLGQSEFALIEINNLEPQIYYNIDFAN